MRALWHILCAAVAPFLLGLPSVAQTPNGRAAVYTCDAVESCSDEGSCASSDHRLFVMETFHSGTEPGPTFFAGPLTQSAGAGLFYEHPVHPLHGATDAVGWFARLPAILGTHLYARVPEPNANRYIVIRPASEMPGLPGTRVVTEFHCTQVLFS